MFFFPAFSGQDIGICAITFQAIILCRSVVPLGGFSPPIELLSRAGNGGVKVCEFVDIFCAHPPKRSQSVRRNQQNPTSASKVLIELFV